MKSEFHILRLKDDLEKVYSEIYAPYAAFSSNNRMYNETAGDFENRGEFQRDRDRIIHSAAFRRLMYKTQVFVNHEGDQFRTRLTHSLEVAQLSRAIAKSLGLNEELCEAISLGHDLGHTPFGHAAEGVFSAKLTKYGLPSFFHNEQSLRVVDILEDRDENLYKGLNLSNEVREGILKHNSDRTGAFLELNPYKPCSTLEGQLVKIIDTVAYTCHDLDDGIKSGILENNCMQNKDIGEYFKNIKEEIFNKTGIGISFGRYDNTRFISLLISFFVEDITKTTYQRLVDYDIRNTEDVIKKAEEDISIVTLSDDVYDLFIKFKNFVDIAVYQTSTVQMMDVKAEKVVGDLFDAFFANTDLLPPEWKYRLNNPDKFSEYFYDNHDKIKARLICDYISCMTDRYALEEHDRVFNPKVKI